LILLLLLDPPLQDEEGGGGGLEKHSDEDLLSQFQDDKQGSESNSGALTSEQRCDERSQGSTSFIIEKMVNKGERSLGHAARSKSWKCKF
jgi:hypothetical protein